VDDTLRTTEVRGQLCPVSRAIRLLEKKWTIHIIYELAEGKQRFCHLQGAIGNANARTLSERLKELEEQGLIHRDVVNTIPPWVEYRLTEKGVELYRLIEGVARWARKWSMFEEECEISQEEAYPISRPCLPCEEMRAESASPKSSRL
jgi:DNA-binding HxlR family transcriptional regulator